MFISTEGDQYNRDIRIILLALRRDSIALFNKQIREKYHILNCFGKSLGAAG